MHFMLDENVPASVAQMLERNGHAVEWIREHVPSGSPDPLVATVSEELDAILVSFDGDFQKISPRVPDGQKRRFRRLSRIWLKCGEPQAAARLEAALGFIQAEFDHAARGAAGRMILQIGKSYLRTDR